MHQHDEPCGCGHSHPHHEHGEHCGCGHAHLPMPTHADLSPLQVSVLMELRNRKYLPVACFAFTKADDEDRYAAALAPVYLSSAEDSMEQVKALGQDLSALEAMDLIALEYDMPLGNYAYDEYKTSTLYAYFVETVAEAAQNPNAAFDTPLLELGSMGLTDAGEKLVDELLGQT